MAGLRTCSAARPVLIGLWGLSRLILTCTLDFMTTKQKKSKSDSHESRTVSSPEFAQDLVEGATSLLESVVNQVFESRRDSYVFQCANRLRELVSDAREVASAAPVINDWVEIESLSRLRTVVGGRFENTKKKWIAAGFPLREHRGDKLSAFVVNEAGWIELSNWIIKQGFETRQNPGKEHCLFELRKISQD